MHAARHNPAIDRLFVKHNCWLDAGVLLRVARPSPRFASPTVGMFMIRLPNNSRRRLDDDSVYASVQSWLGFLYRVPVSAPMKGEDENEMDKKNEEYAEAVRLTLLALRATLVLNIAEENLEYGARYLLTYYIHKALRCQQNLRPIKPLDDEVIRFTQDASEALKQTCIDYFRQTMEAVTAAGGVKQLQRRLLSVDWGGLRWQGRRGGFGVLR